MAGKKFLGLLVLGMLVMVALAAATPKTLNLDFYVFNETGTAQNTSYTGTVRIYPLGSGTASYSTSAAWRTDNSGVAGLQLTNLNLDDDVQYQLTIQPTGETESGRLNITGNLQSIFSENSSWAGGVNWNDVTNRPSGLDDGDDDTQLTQEQVQDFAGALFPGTEQNISCSYDDGNDQVDCVVTISTFGFGDLHSVPSGLADGDDDTIYLDNALTANDSLLFNSVASLTLNISILNQTIQSLDFSYNDGALTANDTALFAAIQVITANISSLNASLVNAFNDDGLNQNDTLFINQIADLTLNLSILNQTITGISSYDDSALTSNDTTLFGLTQDLSTNQSLFRQLLSGNWTYTLNFRSLFEENHSIFINLLSQDCTPQLVQSFNSDGTVNCAPGASGGSGIEWISANGYANVNASAIPDRINASQYHILPVYNLTSGWLNFTGNVRFSDWTDVVITESQISDLSHYGDSALTANDTTLFAADSVLTQNISILNQTIAGISTFNDDGLNQNDTELFSWIGLLGINLSNLNTTAGIEALGFVTGSHTDPYVDNALTANDTILFSRTNGLLDNQTVLNQTVSDLNSTVSSLFNFNDDGLNQNDTNHGLWIASATENISILNQTIASLGGVSENASYTNLSVSDQLVLTGQDVQTIRRHTNTGSLELLGGTSESDGAYFQITGQMHEASPGNGSAEFVILETAESFFNLFTYDGASTWTERMRLVGQSGWFGFNDTTPDGTVSINGDVCLNGVCQSSLWNATSHDFNDLNNVPSFARTDINNTIRNQSINNVGGIGENGSCLVLRGPTSTHFVC